jgi:hypothetical protein
LLKLILIIYKLKIKKLSMLLKINYKNKLKVGINKKIKKIWKCSILKDLLNNQNKLLKILKINTIKKISI